MFSKLYKFIDKEIWEISHRDLSKRKLLLLRQFKILVLTIKGFRKNTCYLRASALTYYTIFSIVPLFALAFAVCKGFGLDDKLQVELYSKFQGNEEALSKILVFTNNLLAKTKGGVIAGIGIIILLWTIIKLFSNIEHSFNAIWGIKKTRTPLRKVTDYLSMAFICPFLLIVSGGLTVFFTSHVLNHVYAPTIVNVVFSSLSSYVIIWILFAFIYKFMPNCKVEFKAAIIPGIIAGTIFCLMQLAYYDLQIGVSKYNAIYGSFAALPLFLLWIQLSWLVVLFGAELSFTYQNILYYEYEYSISNISERLKKLVALRITTLIVKNFINDIAPYTDVQISRNLEIPIRLTREILYELVNSGTISEIATKEEKVKTFQPAHCVDKYNISYVIKSMELNKKNKIHIVESHELKKISETLDSFDKILSKTDSNILLKDI
ncbi:MAG TPA: YihY/virulence factor BrkB family protein [Victivallales bacterium]|nr:YihY/virulence factor BrkB family protein [Victivallales bacterium]